MSSIAHDSHLFQEPEYFIRASVWEVSRGICRVHTASGRQTYYVTLRSFWLRQKMIVYRGDIEDEILSAQKLRAFNLAGRITYEVFENRFSTKIGRIEKDFDRMTLLDACNQNTAVIKYQSESKDRPSERKRLWNVYAHGVAVHKLESTVKTFASVFPRSFEIRVNLTPHNDLALDNRLTLVSGLLILIDESDGFLDYS